MSISIQIVQMVLEHANFFIFRFEEINALTGIDFFSLYLTAHIATTLPPLIDFLSSQAIQIEVAQSLASGAADVANIASQSASLTHNLAPQSISSIADAALNSLESTTEVFLSDADLVQSISPIMEQSMNDYPHTRLISSGLLQTLGLYTNSVLAYLINLGFSII
jgi:hypothetical protein